MGYVKARDKKFNSIINMIKISVLCKLHRRIMVADIEKDNKPTVYLRIIGL